MGITFRVLRNVHQTYITSLVGNIFKRAKTEQEPTQTLILSVSSPGTDSRSVQPVSESSGLAHDMLFTPRLLCCNFEC